LLLLQAYFSLLDALTMINKLFLQIGSLYAFLGVILGAFGAHALKEQLTPDRLASFETGVRYQMYHAIALLVVAILFAHLDQRLLRIIGWLFSIGVLLFSGSIYLLACRELIGLTTYRWLGPITPIGGTCLIIGWGILFFVGLKNR